MTDKPLLNVIVLGGPDVGKSTIIAHLLIEYGVIKRRNAHGPIVMELRNDIRGSRDTGIVTDISLFSFETSIYRVNIVDIPHRDFQKNIITGITLADLAFLVVSCRDGERDDWFSSTGTVRQHALLAYTMGVKNLIVVVNKMDDKWPQDIYNDIKSEGCKMLKKIGYRDEMIHFIPISAMHGDNMFKKSSNWYSGPTLVEVLHQIPLPKRLVDQPLRIPVLFVYKIGGIGTVVVGKVATGRLTPGMIVTFAPWGYSAPVKTIEMYKKNISKKFYIDQQEAIPGDIVGFNVKGLSTQDIRRGHVCGDAKRDPPREISSFVAMFIVLYHPSEISEGYIAELHCGTAHIRCKLTSFTRVDKASGPVKTGGLKKGEAATVTLEPIGALSVERFSEYPMLGRFVVRNVNKIIAVGVVKDLHEKSTSTLLVQ